MPLHDCVAKVEKLSTDLINNLISIGYDVEPISHGLSPSLKDNIGNWIDTHDNFFISWTGAIEPGQRYTLYVGNGGWYINLTDMTFPAKVTYDGAVLEKLSFAYHEMVKEYESKRLADKVEDITTDTSGVLVYNDHITTEDIQFEVVPYSQTINVSPTTKDNTIVAEINLELDAAAENIKSACQSFLNNFMNMNDISYNVTTNSFRVAISDDGVLSCTTSLGDFNCGRGNNTAVYFTPNGSHPIILSNMHTTRGVDTGEVHMLTSTISKAFQTYETIYKNNRSWLILFGALKQSTYDK